MHSKKGFETVFFASIYLGFCFGFLQKGGGSRICRRARVFWCRALGVQGFGNFGFRV